MDLKANPQLMKIETRTDDGVMLGGVMVHPKDRENMRDVTLVYMHGISFDPQAKMPDLLAFADKLNCQIVCFNWRGYAYSEQVKKIDEEGIQQDAQAILEWTVDNLAILGNKRYLMGKSFGTAVATFAATELTTRDGEPCRKVFDGLILEAGFTTAHDAIKFLKPWAPLSLFPKV